MSLRAVFAAVALVASLTVVSPVSADWGSSHGKGKGKDGPRGAFIVEGLTLAGTQFGTPSGLPTTVPTDPLSIPVRAGERFTYLPARGGRCATSPIPPFGLGVGRFESSGWTGRGKAAPAKGKRGLA